MGVADGSIMATIIAAHIMNMQVNSAPLQGRDIDVVTILVSVETIRVPAMSMLVASRPT
jgi:hypothetical protein